MIKIACYLVFLLTMLHLNIFAQKFSTVKIGICTDVHLPTMHDSEYRITTFIDAMKKEKPDFLICAGDFTTFEHDIKTTMRKLSKLGKLFIIHGNHEEATVVRNLSKLYKNIDFIHKKVVCLL